MASRQFKEASTLDYLMEFEVRYRSIEEKLKQEIASDVVMEDEKKQEENR